jgi:hypothetical protein
MLTPNEEAEKYKDLPTKKLKRVIRVYKSLSRSNSDIYNFMFTFVIMMISAFIFIKMTSLTLLLLVLIHYLFFWEFLHRYKKIKLVSDEEREEVDQIIEILEEHLKSRENKKPLN